MATREEGQSVVRVATHEVLRQPVIQWVNIRGLSYPRVVGRIVVVVGTREGRVLCVATREGGVVFCRCEYPRGAGATREGGCG